MDYRRQQDSIRIPAAIYHWSISKSMFYKNNILVILSKKNAGLIFLKILIGSIHSYACKHTNIHHPILPRQVTHKTHKLRLRKWKLMYHIKRDLMKLVFSSFSTFYICAKSKYALAEAKLSGIWDRHEKLFQGLLQYSFSWSILTFSY